MNEYIQEIIKEKIAKVHGLSDIILKNSYPLCKNEDLGVLTSGQTINREAYQIKCLMEQISGLLKK